MNAVVDALAPLAALPAFPTDDEIVDALRSFGVLTELHFDRDAIARARVRAAAVDRLRELHIADAERSVDAALAPIERVCRPLRSDELPEGVDPCTDLAQAHRLAREHGDEVRYCGTLGGWVVWDGRVWKRDDAEAHRRAIDVARRTMAYAVALGDRARTDADRERADRLLVWARRAQGEPQVRHALDLACHLPPVATTTEVWDTDPWLFTCANGTIDLCTGELREHRCGDMITRASPVAYDACVDTSRWDRFLAEILPDPEVRAFVQRTVGYSLTGSTREQCLIICHGSGANGKTTMIETLRHVLGNYAAHAQTDTFMAAGRRGADNDLARLRGARFVTAIESGEGRRLDEPRVKALTGGDTVTARYLYAEPFEFTPSCKIWLATNHRPEVRGTDDGIWRRLRLVPFDVSIPPERRDLELCAHLCAEAPGILAWAVQGCLAWQREGLRPPTAVTASTGEWRAESDVVAQYVADRCAVASHAQASATALYADYRAWAEAQGLDPVTQTALGRRLTAAGYEQGRVSGRRTWRRIGLRAERTE